MPVISGPTSFTIQGFTFRITGIPYKSRTRITLMMQGPYADTLRRYPGIKRSILEHAAFALVTGAPVDTGMLRKSIHVTNEATPAVVIGPKPYHRAKLLAQLAGRTYKQRKRGPVVKAKYYAMPANQRSRRPEYIEKGLRAAAKHGKGLIEATAPPPMPPAVKKMFPGLGGLR